MEAEAFDEPAFFAAIAESGTRALLIGRRALVVLGVPVGTFDYDLWIHIDDIEKLNAALAPLDLFPNRTPVEARARGRYVLENGEKVDVLVARSSPTKDGSERLDFESAWERRRAVPYGGTTTLIALPSIPDLVTTKRWAMRPRDVLDIEALHVLMQREAKR